MEGLPIRQSQVYEYIKEFRETYGYSPTYREIGDKLEMSLTTVAEHITTLTRKGYIRMLYSTGRTLSVVKG